MKSREYCNGFRHGCYWALMFSRTINELTDEQKEMFEKAIKEAVKSLRAGR